jgi:hypothetical protein
MATIEEMQVRLDKLKGTSFKPGDDEQKKIEIAKECERQIERIDEELSEKLQNDARAALLDVKDKLLDEGRDIPIDAFWSLSAYKLCGVGWLVLGPEDKGHAAEALKASGKLDGSGKYQIQQKNPDVCRVAVCRATLACPVEKERLSRALMDAPEFVVAAFEKMRDLGGAYVKDVAGK